MIVSKPSLSGMMMSMITTLAGRSRCNVEAKTPNLLIIIYNQYSRHAQPAFFRIYLLPDNMPLNLAEFVPG